MSVPGLTRRERRAARAERLRGWADKREGKAQDAADRANQLAGMIPMGQPILVGHHSASRHRRDVDRIGKATRASLEHADKAASMRSKAENIDRAAEAAIYADDPDAIELLRERIRGLEERRTAMKDRNAAYRSEHKAALAPLSSYERSLAVPHPPFELTNLGGNIARQRKRLAERGRRVKPRARMPLAKQVPHAFVAYPAGHSVSTSCVRCGLRADHPVHTS